ncbi:MAG: Ig-like domain-containing protein [Saccharofermentans sp.]|nr:Ig-like domain-containing protein [Saccharofermentans sp.]
MKKNYKRICAAIVSAAMVVGNYMPLVNWADVLNPASQYNSELTPMTGHWDKDRGVTFGNNSFTFTGDTTSSIGSSIKITDENLIEAIQDKNCKVPVSIQLSGKMTYPDGINEGADVNVTLGFGATESDAIDDLTHQKKSVLVNGDNTIDFEVADIPAGTKYISLTIDVNYPDGAESSVFVLNNISTNIIDNVKPGLVSNYDDSKAAWTNKPITIKVSPDLATMENVDIDAIYDSNGVMVSDSSTYEFVVDDVSENGEYSFYAVDYATNESQILTINVSKFDNVKPEHATTVSGDIDVWVNDPDKASTAILNSITQDSGSPVSYRYTLDGTKPTITSSKVEDNRITVSDEGEYTVKVSVFDEAGNTTDEVKTFKLMYDHTAPEFATNCVDNGDGTITINVDATDSVSGVSKIYYGQSSSISAYPASGTEVTDGKITVGNKVNKLYIYVEDEAGNKTLEPVSLTFKPVITCDKDSIEIEEDQQNEKIIINLSDDSTAGECTFTVTADSDEIFESLPVTVIDDTSIAIDLNLIKNANTGTGYVTVTVSVVDADGQKCDKPVKIPVYVAPVNDDPEFIDENDLNDAGMIPVQVSEGGSVNIDIGEYVKDVDEDTLTLKDLKLASGKGSVSNDGLVITYKPTAKWYGESVIEVVVDDGNGGSLSVKIHADVANEENEPVAVDDSYTIDEDQENIPAFDVLDNDYDDDIIDDMVKSSYLTVSLPSNTSADGNSISVVDNKIVYKPAENYYGVDTFEYEITDGKFTSTSTVTVEVLPVNDAPIIENVPSSVEISEDSDGTNPANSFTIKVSDVDSPSSQIMVLAKSTNQDLIKNSGVTLTKTDDGDYKITVVPVPDVFTTKSGDVSIEVKVSDGNTSRTFLIPVTITPVNDLPVANDDDMTGKWILFEGKSYPLTGSYLTDIFENDTDIDSPRSSFKIGSMTITSGQGTLAKSPTGQYVYTAPKDYGGDVSVQYTILDDNNGESNAATFTFHVREVDDAPTLVYVEPSNPNFDEDSKDGIILTFKVDDVDTPNDQLIFSFGSSDSTIINTDTVSKYSYDPETGIYKLLVKSIPEANGECEVTLTVSDGYTSVDCPVVVKVNPVQDAPVAADDSYDVYSGESIYIIPTSNDYDLDDETLTIIYDKSIATLPANGGEIEAYERGFLYTAPTGLTEGTTVTMKYSVTDGIDTAEAVITFTITPAPDDMPSIDAPATKKFKYNAASDVKQFSFTVSNLDANGVVNVESRDTNVISNCSIVDVVDNGDGTSTYTCALNNTVNGELVMAGRAIIEVTATNERGITARKYVVVTVTDKNTPPEAKDFTVTYNEKSGGYTITPAQVLADENIYDADGDSISINNIALSDTQSSTLPDRSYLKKNTDGSYTFYPVENNFYGDVKLTYSVKDSVDISDDATITLHVENVEDKPSSDGIWRTVPNEPKAFSSITKTQITNSCYDVDNWYIPAGEEKQKIYVVGYENISPEYGTITYDEATGTFTYTRPDNASEDTKPNAHATVTMKVYISNTDAPMNSVDKSTCGTCTITFFENYSRIDMGISTWTETPEDTSITKTYNFTRVDFPYPVTMSITGNNPSLHKDIEYSTDPITGSSYTFKYIPADDQFGSETLTVKLTAEVDGKPVSFTRNITVYVTPVNDIPVIVGVEPDPFTGWEIGEDETQTFIIEYYEKVDNETKPQDLIFIAAVTKTDEENPVAFTSALKTEILSIDEDGKVTAKVVMPTVPNIYGDVELTFTVSDGDATVKLVSAGKVVESDDLPDVNPVNVHVTEDIQVEFNLDNYVTDIDTPMSQVKYKLSGDDDNDGIVTTANGSVFTIDYDTGAVTYKPALNFDGDRDADTIDETVKYQAGYIDNKTNEWVYSEESINIYIEPVNDAPYIYDLPTYIVGTEDQTPPLTFEFECYDVEHHGDNEHEKLNISFKSSDESILKSEDISFVRDESTGKVTVTCPTVKDAFGTVTITITAIDEEGLEKEATTDIFFSPVNDAPEVVAIEKTVAENVSGAPTNVVVHIIDREDVKDAESDDSELILTVDMHTDNGGRIVKHSNGSITYTPALNWNGTDTFKYTVADPQGGISEETISIIVTPINTAPKPADFAFTIDEGKAYTIADLLEGCTDVEVDANESGSLSVVSVTNTDGVDVEKYMKLVGNSFTFTGPDNSTNETQVFHFDYVVTDNDTNVDRGTTAATGVGHITFTVIPTFDPPVIKDDEDRNKTTNSTWIMNEDETKSFYVLLSDDDTDISKLMVTVESDGQAKGLVRNADIVVTSTEHGKLVTIKPIDNAYGEFTLKLSVSDNSNEVTHDFKVVINPVNDQPTVFGNDIETTEDIPYTNGQLSAKDIETKDGFTYVLVEDAGHGVVTLDSATGKYTYTPDKNYSGTDSFKVAVKDTGATCNNDGILQSEAIVINVNVLPDNDPPISETYNLTINEYHAGDAIPVLSKELKVDDPDLIYGDEVTVAITTNPAHGVAAYDSATKTLTYTPAENNNYDVVIVLTYTDKAGETATCTVNVQIDPVNNKPTGNDDKNGNDEFTIKEDAAEKTYEVLDNDDVDTLPSLNPATDIQKLTLKSVELLGTSTCGVEILEVKDNKISLKPAKDENGDIYVQYVMEDDHGEEGTFVAHFIVEPVNDAPTITAISDQNGKEDIKIEGVTFTIGDIDNDIADLDIEVKSSNGTLLPKENIIVNGDGATRTLTLIPFTDANGYSDVTVTVKDKEPLSASTTFKVYFAPVDDEPKFPAIPDDGETDENTSTVVNVLYNDDPDNDYEGDYNLEILSVTITEESKQLAKDLGYTDAEIAAMFTIGTAEVTEEVTNSVTGKKEEVKVTRPVVVFTPSSDWTSATEQTFVAEYVMRDVDHNPIDPDTSDERVYKTTVSVTVKPVNDKPTIDIDPLTVTSFEDATGDDRAKVTVTVDDEEWPSYPGQPLKLEVVKIVETPDADDTAGIPLLDKDDVELIDNNDGTYTVIVNTNQDEHGKADITLRVTDLDGKPLYAEKTFTVIITSVPDEFSNGNDTSWTNEDTDKIINVLANDSVDVSTQGEKLKINSAGSDVVTHSDLKTAHGGEISIVSVGGVDHIKYTPKKDYFNDQNDESTWDYFYYEVEATTTGATAVFKVVVNVRPVNDPPKITVLEESYSTPEKTVKTFTVEVYDVDNTYDELSLSGTSLNSRIVSNNGGIVISAPVQGANANTAVFTVTVTPYRKYNGTTKLTFVANDGALDSDPAETLFVVTSVNDAPEPEVAVYSVDEGTTKNIDVLANVTDPDIVAEVPDEFLTVTDFKLYPVEYNGAMVDVGTLSIVEVNGKSMLKFTPADDYINFHGDLKFDYEVTDNGGGEGIAKAISVWCNGNTLTVNSVNDKPEAKDITFPAFNEDPTTQPVTYDITAGVDMSDVDLKETMEKSAGAYDENEVLTAKLMSNAPAEAGTVKIVNNQIQYTPKLNYNGTFSVTYQVTDKAGAKSEVKTIYFTVNPINDQPKAEKTEYTTDEGEKLDITVGEMASDVDVKTNLVAEDDKLSFVSVTIDAAYADLGTLEVDPVDPTVIHWVPADSAINYNGIVTFKAVITDDGSKQGNGNTDLTVEIPGKITIKPVNDPPVEVDKNLEVDEGETLVIDISDLATDVDVDTNADSLKITEAALNDEYKDYGTFKVSDDGKSITYTPNTEHENFHGTIKFTATIVDNGKAQGGTNGNATLIISDREIKVVSVNDKPTAEKVVSDNYAEDCAEQTIDINDYVDDVDVTGYHGTVDPADKLTITADWTDLPTGAEILYIDANGILHFKPAKDFNGTITVSYTVTDAYNESATNDIVLRVEADNDEPVAKDAAFKATEDKVPEYFDLDDYISDVDGDDLTAVLVGDVPDGLNVVIKDNKVYFTPDLNYNGKFEISYKVIDDGAGKLESDVKTITITIEPDNDAPVEAKTTFDAVEGKTKTIDVNEIASDVDVKTNLVAKDDVLAFVSVALDDKYKDYGTLEVTDDNTLTWTPADEYKNYFGDITFTCVVTDDGAHQEYGNKNLQTTIAGTIKIASENDAPAANAIQITTTEDSGLVTYPITIGVDISDVDLKETMQKSGGAYDPNESLKTYISPYTSVDPTVGTVEIKDNVIYYTPAPDYNGQYVFTYVVEDAYGAIKTNAVLLTVTPVNDAPTMKKDTFEVDEGESLDINVDDIAQDKDMPSATSPKDKLSYESVTIDPDYAKYGTIEIVDDVTIRYTPNPGYENYNGIIKFTCVVTDNGEEQQYGNTNLSVEIPATITVKPVNDAPVEVDKDFDVDEGESLTIDIKDLATDVDIDTNGDVLTIIDVSLTDEYADFGDIKISDDGKSITYTPNYEHENYHGIVKFNCSITDNGSAQGNNNVNKILVITDREITVNSVNDIPTATKVVESLPEDSVDYKIDMNKYVDDVDLTGERGTVDPDEKLTVTLDDDTDYAKVSIDANNILHVTPKPNYNGVIKLHYTVTDAYGEVAKEEIELTITPEDDDPTAVDDEETTLEDTPVDIIVLKNDSDTDSDPDLNLDPNKTINTAGLKVISVDNDDTVSKSLTLTTANGGTVAVNSDNTVTYTPAKDYFGIDTFKYTIENEDGLTATATVTVTVESVNDAPTAEAIEEETDEDTTLKINLNDYIDDVDLVLDGNEKLVCTIVSSDDDSCVSIDENNNLTYVPVKNFHGTFNITYKVTDAYGETAENTITITVNSVNDVPVANDDEAEVISGNTVVVEPLLNDTDEDEDAVLSIVPDSFKGSVPGAKFEYDPATGKFTYTAPEDFVGVDEIEYTLTDEHGATDVGVIRINVTPADYTIVVEPEVDFGKVNDQYVEAPEGVEVTITNKGNKPVFDISIPELENYDVSGDIPTSLKPGESFKVVVTPKLGLPAGDYSTELVVKTHKSQATTPISFEIIKTYKVTVITDAGSDATHIAGFEDIVEAGTDYSVKFTVKDGYSIKDVKVNGVSKGAINEYTIVAIDCDTVIEVITAKKAVVSTGEETDNNSVLGCIFIATALAGVSLRVFKRKNEKVED